MTSVFSSENNVRIAHLINDRKTQKVITALAQIVSAPLETLLDRDADPDDFSAGLSADIQKTVNSLSVREEIIDDENLVIRAQELLGQSHRIVDPVSKGMNDGSVEVTVQVAEPETEMESARLYSSDGRGVNFA